MTFLKYFRCLINFGFKFIKCLTFLRNRSKINEKLRYFVFFVSGLTSPIKMKYFIGVGLPLNGKRETENGLIRNKP